MSINATLIGQMITFAVLIWFSMTYIWPPLLKALEEREKKIADGLAAADKAKQELATAEQQAQDAYAEAKKEAASIVEMARKQSADIVAEAKQIAQREADRIAETAQAEISREVEQATETLRADVSRLAINAAQKILGQEVDEGKHRQMLQDVASKLGSAS
ncbi:MAG: F0F1 ATP synthase subunit B [Gammaproteobacteria bacterium]|nr:F0F1 ATP synthase subunit B [Gammaproteobacteria bacterium]